MDIDTVYERLWRYDRGISEDSIDDIRRAIINLLAEKLGELESRLGYWEKEHFDSAVTAFVDNVNRGEGTVWLRYCLVCLEKAFVPAKDRSEVDDQDDEVGALSFDDLAQKVDNLNRLVP